MTFWVDAQFSPSISIWIQETFGLEVRSVKELGLRDATDQQIFFAAKDVKAIIMTKDSDFLELLNRFGTPPQVLWITSGNTSNAALKSILLKNLSKALSLFDANESIVEISDRW